MARSVTLRLDLATGELPTSNTTRRAHYFAQAATAKSLRTRVAVMARDMGQVEPPARLTARIAWGDRIRRDVDNVSLKAITDGLVDAGVLADDRWEVLPQVHRHVSPIHGQRGRVHIEVTVETIRERVAGGG